MCVCPFTIIREGQGKEIFQQSLRCRSTSYHHGSYFFIFFPKARSENKEDLCSFAPCNSLIQRSEYFFKVARLEGTM